MIGREHQHFHRFIVLFSNMADMTSCENSFWGKKNMKKGSGIQVSPDQFGIEREPA